MRFAHAGHICCAYCIVLTSSDLNSALIHNSPITPLGQLRQVATKSIRWHIGILDNPDVIMSDVAIYNVIILPKHD